MNNWKILPVSSNITMMWKRQYLQKKSLETKYWEIVSTDKLFCKY